MHHWPNIWPKNHSIAFESRFAFSFILLCLTIIWHWSFFSFVFSCSLYLWLFLSVWNFLLFLLCPTHIPQKLFFFLCVSLFLCSTVCISFCHECVIRAYESNKNQHNRRKFVSANIIASAINTRWTINRNWFILLFI